MTAESAAGAPLPRGARLAVDVGTVRVGVAASDRDGLVATPVETVPRGSRRDPADLARLAELAAEREVAVVYVGLPRRLQGDEGPAAAAAREYAGALAALLVPVPVHLVDERLTTAAATKGLRAGGVGSRKGRAVIDQAAAVMILSTALDTERATGRRAGERVTLPAGGDVDGPDPTTEVHR